MHFETINPEFRNKNEKEGMMKFWTILSIILISFSNHLFCQKTYNFQLFFNENDSSETERVSILPDDFSLFGFESDFHRWKSNKQKPYLSIETGQANFSSNESNLVDFQKHSNVLVSLGYCTNKEDQKSTLFTTTSNEFFVSHYLTDFIKLSKTESGYKLKNWQAGLNWGDGAGNKLHKNFKLYFNYKDGISWTKFDFVEKNNDTNYLKIFDRYNKLIKFGEQFQSSASIIVFENVGLQMSYNRSNVYPAFMFWYWSVSKLTEVVAHGILDEFIKDIQKASPDLSPLAFILLKTGLSYGIYELRRNNMNWPINTEAPFVMESFNIGLNINF